MRAEVKVAMMLVKHNNLADELTPYFHDIYTDSEIASSRHTKTACIIIGAIAPFFQKNLVDVMKREPYTIAIDGSSDTGREKMNPLTVRVFDIAHDTTVSTKFLDTCMSSSATAEGIFSKIEAVLDKHNILFGNCVGIGLDNTSVNMGCRNSIKTRILQKNPAIQVMGCPCHILHNTASRAGVAFQMVGS